MDDGRLARFWVRVDKSGECWNWTGSTDSGGYGLFNVGNRMGKAHRFAWEMENGPIHDGLFVLHHCDNRLCVRTAHLFLGTQKDNVADMDAKGRRGRGYKVAAPYRGGNHQAAKLSDDKVAAIRAAILRGDRQVDVAAWFGISRTWVGLIARGKERVD